MWHLVPSTIYSVVPINSSPLTIIHSSVRTTLIHNDTKYSLLCKETVNREILEVVPVTTQQLNVPEYKYPLPTEKRSWKTEYQTEA
jgi:hypothetical protein